MDVDRTLIEFAAIGSAAILLVVTLVRLEKWIEAPVTVRQRKAHRWGWAARRKA